jgi:hypothetical protein
VTSEELSAIEEHTSCVLCVTQFEIQDRRTDTSSIGEMLAWCLQQQY